MLDVTTISYLLLPGALVAPLLSTGHKIVGRLMFETFLFVRAAEHGTEVVHRSNEPVFLFESKATFLALPFARVIKECRKNAIGADGPRPKLSVLRRKT
jgi:hypothetical protein